MSAKFASFVISSLLFSSQAVAMQKKMAAKQEVRQEQSSYALIFERLIGEKTQQEARSVFIHCKVYEHQLEELDTVKSLIKEAKKAKELTALHIVPTVPSQTYLVYDGEERINIHESSSKTVSKDGEASKKLKAMIDQRCQF